MEQIEGRIAIFYFFPDGLWKSFCLEKLVLDLEELIVRERILLGVFNTLRVSSKLGVNWEI